MKIIKKLTTAKSYILLTIIMLIVFLSNDFTLIALQKTAIVASVGIDKVDDNIEVTMQVAMPQASATTTENNDAVITGRGKTVAEAISEVGSKTGWYPKMSFCNLIVLGEGLLTENSITVTDFFAKTFRVQDSAVIAICKGTARELMSTATPLDNISSFALQKILFKNAGNLSDVAEITVKDFSIGYYSRTGTAFAPFIKTLLADESEQTSPKGKQGEEGSGAGQKSGSERGNQVFDATDTIVFKNGIGVTNLDTEQTRVLNSLTKKVNLSTYPVSDITIDGETFDALLTIKKHRAGIKLDVVNGIPTVNFYSYFFCRMEDANSKRDEINMQDKIFLPKEVSEKATEQFTETLLSIVEKCRTYGVDIFNLDEQLYKYHNEYYPVFKDNLYDFLQVKTSVTFTGTK